MDWNTSSKWNWNNSKDGACDPRPLVIAPELVLLENSASGEAAHTALTSWPQWHHTHRELWNSSNRGSDPVSPEVHTTLDSTLPPQQWSLWAWQHQHSKSTHKPSSFPLFHSAYRGRTSSSAHPGDGRKTHHPSVSSGDAINNGNNKVPATPEAQEETMKALGDTSGRGGKEWKVPILKHNQRQLR